MNEAQSLGKSAFCGCTKNNVFRGGDDFIKPRIDIRDEFWHFPDLETHDDQKISRALEGDGPGVLVVSGHGGRIARYQHVSIRTQRIAFIDSHGIFGLGQRFVQDGKCIIGIHRAAHQNDFVFFDLAVGRVQDILKTFIFNGGMLVCEIQPQHIVALRVEGKPQTFLFGFGCGRYKTALINAGRHQSVVFRGSKASRTASPINVSSVSMKASEKNAEMPSHGA